MTTYATPVTPTDFANLIALITWPQDCNYQKAAMDRCLDVLSALKRGWAAMQPVRLYVGSDTPPGLADWQAAWVDLGYALPISGNVIGIWETLTNTIKDGGQYAWIENDMRPTLAKWWNGSSEFILTTPNMYSNNALLTASETIQFTQIYALDRAAYIEAAWALVPVSPTTPSANFLQWRCSDDAALFRRGFVSSALVATDSMHIYTIRRFASNKLSSGVFSLYFSGSSPVTFTNVAVTRKIETGYYFYSSSHIGEFSALSTEAVYLT